MKPFEILPHTADFRIRVFGKDEEELFKNAFSAIFLMSRPPKLDQEIKTEIKVKSLEQNTLLVDFLNAVLLQMQIKRAIFNEIKIKKLTKDEIEAKITGRKIEEFSRDIKAATYHEVDIKKSSRGGLETNLVFDI